MKNLLSAWTESAKTLLDEANSASIISIEDVLDHIGIRCGNDTDFSDLKNQLSSEGDLLGEVQINGRPIATYKLRTPLSIGRHGVSVVELMAPKPYAPAKVTCFDHIEVVIGEGFIERRARSSKVKWSHLKWPSVINPEIEATLSFGVVKFHLMTLERVIEVEHKVPSVLDVKVPPPTAFSTWIFDIEDTLMTRSKDAAKRANACRPIIEMLRDAEVAGCQLAVWTEFGRDEANAVLEELGLKIHLDYLVTASEFEKPSRINWISEAGAKCILVGDSIRDRDAAKQNGIDFLEVPQASFLT